jgi:hypothetical protein
MHPPDDSACQTIECKISQIWRLINEIDRLTQLAEYLEMLLGHETLH